MATDAPDGVYFNMAEEVYHGLPRLSASGVANLRISPATFWARSWMNPDKAEQDDPTKAQILGRAYDVAYLTPDRFDKQFVRQVDKDDFEIVTHADIKAALKDRGLKPTLSSDEGVLEAAMRLRDHGFADPIYHIALAAQNDDGERTGRTPIRGDYYDQIITDAERLRMDPDVGKLVTGGFAQVSILWTDEKSRIKWKARIDYLSPEAIVDLKTFENSSGKEVERCLADAVRYNRYYIQAVLYWQAIERLRGSADVQRETILHDAGKDQQRLIGDICNGENAPLEWWWVFIEKGGVPNILARQFRMTNDPHPHHLYQAPTPESREVFREKMKRPSQLFEKARLEIDDAVKVYQDCMEIWGEREPWGSLRPVGEIGDEDFAPYWLEE